VVVGFDACRVNGDHGGIGFVWHLRCCVAERPSNVCADDSLPVVPLLMLSLLAMLAIACAIHPGVGVTGCVWELGPASIGDESGMS